MNKKSLFETPVFRFMERTADFFILNAMTGLLLLPVVTAGPALTACCRVMQSFVWKEELPIVASYFRAFKENFKQGMILGLLTLLALALLAVNLSVVYLYFEGTLAYILYMVLLVAAIALLGTAVYAFSLMARYDNTLKQHLYNGLFLALGYLPRTVVLLVLYGIPLVLAVWDINFFMKSSIFWVMIGMSLIIYSGTRLIAPVFLRLDAQIAEQECEDEVTDEPAGIEETTEGTGL